MKILLETLKRMLLIILVDGALYIFAPDIAEVIGVEMDTEAARRLVIIAAVVSFLLLVVYPLRFLKRN